MSHIAFKIIARRAMCALEAVECAEGLEDLARRMTPARRRKAEVAASEARAEASRLTALVRSFDL